VKEELDVGIVVTDFLKVSAHCQAAYKANKILGTINRGNHIQIENYAFSSL